MKTYSKLIASVTAAVLLLLMVLPGAAFAVSEESEREFREIKNGMIDGFNGEKVNLNKDIKIKLKSPEFNLAQSAMLNTISFVIKTDTNDSGSIMSFSLKFLGLGAVYCSVDRSERGIGLYLPKLDKTYYVIDSALLDELLQMAAEELGCQSWEEASEWLKSITLRDILGEMNDYTDMINENLDVKITSSSPSTVEYPSAFPVVIDTVDELYSVMEHMSENIPALFEQIS
ncbi:MAG: hypothetical protein Q4F31_08845 [Eubacteriales bacterium]|nr:hypothetical protein [Eubacteriales bacterium]